MGFYQHNSAIVDGGAQIGDGSRIWHFVHVCTGARIGREVSLGQNVFAGNRVPIGDRYRVQNNVSVYDDVTLEEGVFCGSGMAFTNVYSPRSLIERKSKYLNTLVKRGTTLRANCTIICEVAIGSFAFIRAGAVVASDVPSYALMVGVPARQVGWMSEYDKRLDLPVNEKGKTTCPRTGDTYRLSAGGLMKELAV